MAQSSELTALSYNVDLIGKLFSDSKARHTWTMDIDGETHVVVLTASWNSGKFVVELNGYERFHQVVSGVFMYSFRFRDRFFKIEQLGDKFSLLIDTIAFSQYTARAKQAQAAVLKSYAAASATVSSRERSSSSEPSERPLKHEPFSGDLAKRLGKTGKTAPATAAAAEGYVAHSDDEDLFAAPVNIQSFVTPPQTSTPIAEYTVIPNLIEFADAPIPDSKPSVSAVPSVPRVPVVAAVPLVAAAVVVAAEDVTPVASQVTPKNQISPSKLTNPFAAFDEIHLSSTKDNPFQQ